MINGTAVLSLQYADDLVIMSTTESGLHRCLGKLELYCKKLMLEVNINKTKVMIFHEKKMNPRRCLNSIQNEKLVGSLQFSEQQSVEISC